MQLSLTNDHQWHANYWVEIKPNKCRFVICICLISRCFVDNMNRKVKENIELPANLAILIRDAFLFLSLRK